MYFFIKTILTVTLFDCSSGSGGSLLCSNTDCNDFFCWTIEKTFSLAPLKFVVNALAGLLSAVTNFFQAQGIVSYITQSFQSNPLDTTNYFTMASTFKLVIFYPGGCGPHIIGLSEVLIDCTAVKSNGTSTKLLWSGYGSNCNDTSPLETIFHFKYDEMQQWADASDATIIAVDWGASGLSCYGYIQIVFCLLSKIVDLFVFWLINCVDIKSLELYGHSLGAQIIGYIAQKLKAIGFKARAVIGLDPAGPGFGPPFRCQGIVNECAEYVAVYHVNPGGLGTADQTQGNAIFLINPQKWFCQPDCNCFNASCSHSYIWSLFLRLTQNVTINAIRSSNSLTPCVGTTVILTAYGPMPNGIYCVNTYENHSNSVTIN